MQMLPTELKVQNRTLKQIKRQGKVALYELYGANEMLYGFEVIVVKIRKAEHSFGKDYPEREVYPSNEDWGSFAWSYGRNDREMAERTFVRLLSRSFKDVPIDDFRVSEGKDSGSMVLETVGDMDAKEGGTE